MSYKLGCNFKEFSTSAIHAFLAHPAEVFQPAYGVSFFIVDNNEEVSERTRVTEYTIGDVLKKMQGVSYVDTGSIKPILYLHDGLLSPQSSPPSKAAIARAISASDNIEDSASYRSGKSHARSGQGDFYIR